MIRRWRGEGEEVEREREQEDGEDVRHEGRGK